MIIRALMFRKGRGLQNTIDRQIKDFSRGQGGRPRVGLKMWTAEWGGFIGL